MSMVHSSAEDGASIPTGEAAPLRPTPGEIEAGRSPAGGFTKDQLAAWGVAWPPPKGWKERLTAGEVFEAYVPEPVTPEVEAWSRALCEAMEDEPDRIVGCPALPLWRSYITYARHSITAARRVADSASDKLGGYPEGMNP